MRDVQKGATLSPVLSAVEGTGKAGGVPLPIFIPFPKRKVLERTPILISEGTRGWLVRSQNLVTKSNKAFCTKQGYPFGYRSTQKCLCSYVHSNLRKKYKLHPHCKHHDRKNKA